MSGHVLKSPGILRQNISMIGPIDILEVECIEGCGLIVRFTDGTYAAYTPEELKELRPYREPVGVSESN